MRRRTIERKHTIKSKTITVLLVACLIALIPATVTAEEQAIVPDDVRAQQIKDMKFGMFVCWSFSTFSGYEWTRGVEDVGFFRATGCDTDQWCKTAKDRVEPLFLRIAEDTVWETQLQSTSGIEVVKMTGNDQFVTVERLIQNRGHRIVRRNISGSGVPEEVEDCYAYWPYLAPNQKWVFYKQWYPRMGTPDEYQHTSTWMVDITQPEFAPVLVYPPDSKTGAAHQISFMAPRIIAFSPYSGSAPWVLSHVSPLPGVLPGPACFSAVPRYS